MTNREIYETPKEFQLIPKDQPIEPSNQVARALGWNIGNIFVSPGMIAFCNIHSIRPEASVISSVIIGGILAQRASSSIDQSKDYFQLIPTSR